MEVVREGGLATEGGLRRGARREVLFVIAEIKGVTEGSQQGEVGVHDLSFGRLWGLHLFFLAFTPILTDQHLFEEGVLHHLLLDSLLKLKA